MGRPRAEKRGKAVTIYLSAAQLEFLETVCLHPPAALRKLVNDAWQESLLTLAQDKRGRTRGGNSK
jgi:hypothetical protein